MAETSEAQITNLDNPVGGDENIGGLQVTVDDMRIVEIQYAVQKLEKEGLDNRYRYRVSKYRRVVMDNLLMREDIR